MTIEVWVRFAVVMVIPVLAIWLPYALAYVGKHRKR